MTQRELLSRSSSSLDVAPKPVPIVTDSLSLHDFDVWRRLSITAMEPARRNATPFINVLTEDSHTAQLMADTPPWGRPLRGVPAGGGFQMSDWHDLVHVLLHRLARHHARTVSAVGGPNFELSLRL